jgi:hypothetical protein
MERHVKKTHDLENGWYANMWSDGAITLRNPDIGQRIDLPKSSVDRLKEIFETAGVLAA